MENIYFRESNFSINDVIIGDDTYSVLNQLEKIFLKQSDKKMGEIRGVEEKFKILLKNGFSDDFSIEFLEDKPVFEVNVLKPFSVFNDMNIVGIDGSSLVFRGHPFKVIFARTAIFSHSQKRVNVLKLSGIYKVLIKIVSEVYDLIDLDTYLRAIESETLNYLESLTIKDICEKFGGFIDILFKDGPISRAKQNGIDLFNVFYTFGIPAIGIIKNSYAKFITNNLDIGHLYDSDFFSFLLRPNTRSPFFRVLDKGNLFSGIVMAYYMTPKRNVLRIEVPEWVYEEYGPEKIMNFVAADVLLGKGSFSYILGRADKLAKFSESERRIVLRRLEEISLKLGADAPHFFNDFRWGLRSLRKW